MNWTQLSFLHCMPLLATSEKDSLAFLPLWLSHLDIRFPWIKNYFCNDWGCNSSMHCSVHLTYSYSFNSQEDFPVSGTDDRVEKGGEGRLYTQSLGHGCDSCCMTLGPSHFLSGLVKWAQLSISKWFLDGCFHMRLVMLSLGMACISLWVCEVIRKISETNDTVCWFFQAWK